jgi:hypothetical protein
MYQLDMADMRFEMVNLDMYLVDIEDIFDPKLLMTMQYQ